MGTKILIWLGKTLATVVLTVMLTLWLSGLIITSVVQSILEEYEIPLEVEPVIYSGVLGYLWGYNDTDLEQAKSKEQDISVSGLDKLDNEEAKPSEAYEQLEDTEEEQDAVEVLAPVEMEEQVEISKNELGETKSGLTDTEKERLLELIVEKIPADQWQTISLYLEDGLSEKELLDTQQILAQYLTDAEYTELMAILKKS